MPARATEGLGEGAGHRRVRGFATGDEQQCDPGGALSWRHEHRAVVSISRHDAPARLAAQGCDMLRERTARLGDAAAGDASRLARGPPCERAGTRAPPRRRDPAWASALRSMASFLRGLLAGSKPKGKGDFCAYPRASRAPTARGTRTSSPRSSASPPVGPDCRPARHRLGARASARLRSGGGHEDRGAARRRPRRRGTGRSPKKTSLPWTCWSPRAPSSASATARSRCGTSTASADPRAAEAVASERHGAVRCRGARRAQPTPRRARRTRRPPRTSARGRQCSDPGGRPLGSSPRPAAVHRRFALGASRPLCGRAARFGSN